MIRVLHVIDHLDLGGAQTALLDMLGCRDRKAFAVEVAVMHGRGHFASALEAIGVPVRVLSAAKWPPAYLHRFLACLNSGDYDVLHFHLQGANWIAKPLAALAGHPIRISHDHASGDIGFRGKLSLLPDALSHRFSTQVVAVSEGGRDFLQKWEAVPDESISVVSNGVNTTEFSPGEGDEKIRARSKWNIAPEARVVGAMGRLAWEKNFLILPELAQLHPGLHFLLAGEGPEETAILAKAKKLQVDDRIQLCGRVSDRVAFYRALDVFLLPSLHEGLPMVLLEAMAVGVPVLASRLEGIAAALRDGQEGLLADAGQVMEFSRALGQLNAAPEPGKTLAAAGRARVQKWYSAAETARGIERLYRQELAHGGSAGR